MKYAKRTGRGLEVASHTYVNQKTGDTVKIVGVMHIAHDNFWSEVKRELDLADQRGYAVHLEGVGNADSAKPLPEETVKMVGTLMKFLALPLKMAEVVGLTHQRNALQLYMKTFPRKDLNVVEVVEHMPPKIRKNLAEYSNADKDLELFDDPDGKVFIGPIVLFMLRHVQFFSTLQKMNILRNDIMHDSAVLDLRNEHAIKEALAEPKKNRLLLWGAAHLKGMGKLLRKEGYTLTEVEWRVVIPKSHRAPKSE